MWDQKQKQRFQELRTRELQDQLTEAEQTELLGMIHASSIERRYSEGEA
jgi:hypothetical protein